MPEAEGRLVEWESEGSIRTEWLEAIPYEGERQHVSYMTDEFSAVCPFSGLPDFGNLEITYVPATKLVELKSLKYYIISFRQVGIYQENAVVRIYRDLWNLLTPRYLKVSLKYNLRGGIRAVCEKASAPASDLDKILYPSSESP